MQSFLNGLWYMFQFMPVLAVGFMAAYGFTPLTRRLALHLNIVDQPSARKVHREPTPLLGGIAILGGFLLAMLLFAPPTYFVELGAVLAGSLWLAIVGYVDDRNGMNPRTKLAAQFTAGIFLLIGGIHIQLFKFAPLDYLLTLFWVVGITNALNLMDNMDGLAAGITTI